MPISFAAFPRIAYRTKHIKLFMTGIQQAVATEKRHLESDIITSVPNKKRPRKLKRYRAPSVDSTSVEGVLRNDIKDLFLGAGLDPATIRNNMDAFINRDRLVPWPAHKEVNLSISTISSVGVGLALHGGKAVVVPYTLPGDIVTARIYRTEEYYYEAEMIDVLEKSRLRKDELVKCQYFRVCSGCQYQMTDYKDQLELKREVVRNAMRHYAPKLFASGVLPDIHETVGSPLLHGYRTKLTPHFDVPRKGRLNDVPPIGFGVKGRNTVVDIEECGIGTPIVNKGMAAQRSYVASHFAEYQRGATLLLREHTDEKTGEKTCVTDSKQIVTENVDGFKFRFPAGTFFQNNNSILPLVTKFVRDHVAIEGKPPKYLVDTYCGSGLFAITCSTAVHRVIGVEISVQSVEYANSNAKLNGITNSEFIVGQAERIFEHVSQAPNETAVVIDPPRKGCDKEFLDQLLEFRPAKVVYVSCNVHSQARDLEYIHQHGDYKVESLGGFDFFPQTYHVEGVAVLSRR